MSTILWMYAYSVLSSYCLAGCLAEHFIVIRGWRYVGVAEFSDVHKAQGNSLGFVYVTAKLALTAMIVTLLVVRPTGTTLSLLWTSAGLLAVSWVVSFILQFPLQAKLRRRKNMIDLGRLYQIDWVRVAAMVTHNAVVVGLAATLLQRPA